MELENLKASENIILNGICVIVLGKDIAIDEDKEAENSTETKDNDGTENDSETRIDFGDDEEDSKDDDETVKPKQTIKFMKTGFYSIFLWIFTVYLCCVCVYRAMTIHFEFIK